MANLNVMQGVGLGEQKFCFPDVWGRGNCPDLHETRNLIRDNRLQSKFCDN